MCGEEMVSETRLIAETVGRVLCLGVMAVLWRLRQSCGCCYGHILRNRIDL